MSYAIIRNTNYKMKNLKGIYKHNERKNTNYSNKDINKEQSKQNYSIKAPYSTYEKIFKDMKKKYNLKGMIKQVSNVMCEFIITSDKDFFESIGKEETKRYFQTAYKFVSNYKNLGEEFIVSAKVHMDESTPHIHIIFIPVVHKFDTKSGKQISKIACSEYWKGRDSYKRLQDNFYKYMTNAGFDLERGLNGNEHIDIENLKKVTNYEVQKYEMQSIKLEKEKEITDTEELRKEYKRIIRKFNIIAKNYTKVKTLTDNIIQQNESVEIEYHNIKQENSKLKQENKTLKQYVDKTFEYVSLLFDFSKERLKRLVDLFIQNNNIDDKEMKKFEKRRN